METHRRFATSIAGATIVVVAILAPSPANTAEVRPRSEQTRALFLQLRTADEALASGRLGDALRSYDEALAAARELGGETILLARAADGRADVARLEGDSRTAERLYRVSAELWPRLLGRKQPRTGVTLHNLGLVLLHQDRVVEALESFERAHGIFVESFGAESSQATNTARGIEQAKAAPRVTGDAPASGTPPSRR